MSLRTSRAADLELTADDIDRIDAVAPEGAEAVRIMTDLPRTPSGKIQKFALRDQVLA